KRGSWPRSSDATHMTGTALALSQSCPLKRVLPMTDADTSATAWRSGSRCGGRTVAGSIRMTVMSVSARQRSARSARSELPSHRYRSMSSLRTVWFMAMLVRPVAACWLAWIFLVSFDQARNAALHVMQHDVGFAQAHTQGVEQRVQNLAQGLQQRLQQPYCDGGYTACVVIVVE